MRRARLLGSLLVVSALVQPSAALAAPVGPAPVAGEIDQSLLETLEAEGSASFVVVFDDRADLGRASAIADFRRRGQFVVDKLQAVAESAQSAALELVEAGDGKATPYWVRNTMVVEGDAQLAEDLAALPGVAEVRPERVFPLIDPVKPTQEAEGLAPEWGIDKIGAPEAWERGIVGGGVVVANVDSGVDFTHPALSTQYRGNLGDGSFVHDYNWFDPTGSCDEPCDTVGHGTHTMGTMVGGDGPGPFTPDVGVAPGATWIAAKGCEDFGCSEESLLAAGQWILAPTDRAGGNPDPGKRPDIVNNSWGGPPGDDFYADLVIAWRAAGMVPVFASGNPGPFCGEGGSPGDYAEAISVGATDVDDVIADFSGRGPSVYGKINPNVSAPGVDILSSFPGGGYEFLSGTSMAAPHVAGTIALMMSARTDLMGDVDGVQDALEATAIDIVDVSCGGDDDGDPNNVYGEGRIDAATAVAVVATGGHLEGVISDAAGGALGGARVVASNGERNFVSVAGEDGAYRLFLAAGVYTVSVELFGYESQLVSGVEIVTDATTVQDFALEVLPRYQITGRVVYAENRSGVPAAQVGPVGVPVEPVRTDRFGRFRISLPLGAYTLEARQSGCSTVGTAEVELNANTQLTIEVTRKIDDFGHGCAPLRSRPQSGRFQTALYGDDAYGRLRLPFDFPFYDGTYSEVFVTTNGYLSFEDPFYADFFNTEIPSSVTPNTAVYPLWTDLVIDQDGLVTYASGGRSPNRWFVVAYESIKPLGGASAFDMSVTLWENGNIDMAYGGFTGPPGDGSTATIGIEAANGDDAFQFAFREPVLQPNTAYRYSVVPTGVVVGTVTDANDGLPIAGAVVTAEPSGRAATTGEDGTYALRLVPGSYTLTASADDYESSSAEIDVEADATPTVDFSLKAPVAVVAPAAVEAETELGASVTETLTISNIGSAPLIFDARERDRSEGQARPIEEATGPAGERLIRPNEWAPYRPPVGSVVPAGAVGVTYAGPLDVVINDPVGDAVGSVDVTQVLGGTDGVEASIQIDVTEDSPVDLFSGYFFLDTDQDMTTGISPEELFGLPTQQLGIDYFVDMFGAYQSGTVLVVDANLFEVVAEVPVVFDGHSLRFDIGLDVLGGDDGAMNVGTVVGDDFEPTDWAPDEGAGVLEPFRDAPWMTVDPASGVLDPGESLDVRLVLGGEGVDPGSYRGDVVFVTNDPRTSYHAVEVALEVNLPPGFGSVAGTVTNERAGFPIPATLAAMAALDGTPYPISATADDAGRYALFGPAGTWPLTVTSEGYVGLDSEITIPGDAAAVLDIALTPEWPFATLDGAPIELTVGSGASDSAQLTLGNREGIAPLSFTVDELDMFVAGFGVAGLASSLEAPAGHVASAVEPNLAGQPVLVVMDALPWDSDAIFQLLDAVGASYDVAGSADLPDLDLAGYGAVFVSNDQPQDFYSMLESEMPALEDYVSGGGFLWLGVAGWGWQGGDPSGLPLPGGGTVDGFDPWEENQVVSPDHPVVAGVPSPFFGSEASHTTVSGYPAGTVIATTPPGDTTLVEYTLGAGRVMVVAQPVEYGWAAGEDSGSILANGVPYVLDFQPFTDVPWLSAVPSEGTVDPGETQPIRVDVDATGLDPGTYQATLVVSTNDPLSPRLLAPVTLTVTP